MSLGRGPDKVDTKSQTEPGGGWRELRGETQSPGSTSGFPFTSRSLSKKHHRGLREGCDRSAHSVTLIHTHIYTHAYRYTLTQIRQASGHTLTVHTSTQTRTNPTSMHAHGYRHTPTPHPPTTLVTHNPSPITLSPSVTFPRFALLSSHITLALTCTLLPHQHTLSHTPPAVSHGHQTQQRWMAGISPLLVFHAG